MDAAGINGCKAGWLLVSFTEGAAKYAVLHGRDELEKTFSKYGRIFINIPIGLEDSLYERNCDQLLKTTLGRDYADDVVSPPVRSVLDAPSYAEANFTTFETTGKNLALRAWNITQKIKDVDSILRAHPAYAEKVLESSPELLFQKLNGGMIYQKPNLKKGIKHRLELIKAREAIADDFFREIKEQFRRSEVDEHDIVNAFVLAYFAKLSTEKDVLSLPETIIPDARGMKKAIHFVRP